MHMYMLAHTTMGSGTRKRRDHEARRAPTPSVAFGSKIDDGDMPSAEDGDSFK